VPVSNFSTFAPQLRRSLHADSKKRSTDVWADFPLLQRAPDFQQYVDGDLRPQAREDEDLKLLSAINRLMRDGEGSVFAARAQSEQRSVEKVAHRGLREKAKEMLKGYIQKLEMVSESESDSASSDSSRTQELVFNNTFEEEKSDREVVKDLVKKSSSDRDKKQNKDETLEYTMSVNESNGA